MRERELWSILRDPRYARVHVMHNYTWYELVWVYHPVGGKIPEVIIRDMRTGYTHVFMPVLCAMFLHGCGYAYVQNRRGRTWEWCKIRTGYEFCGHALRR